MPSTDTIWISSLLHLNESIVAAQIRLSVQASRIMDALEMREDIIEKEGLFSVYRDNLHLLRLARDALLSQVEE